MYIYIYIYNYISFVGLLFRVCMVHGVDRAYGVSRLARVYSVVFRVRTCWVFSFRILRFRAFSRDPRYSRRKLPKGRPSVNLFSSCLCVSVCVCLSR